MKQFSIHKVSLVLPRAAGMEHECNLLNSAHSGILEPTVFLSFTIFPLKFYWLHLVSAGQTTNCKKKVGEKVIFSFRFSNFVIFDIEIATPLNTPFIWQFLKPKLLNFSCSSSERCISCWSLTCAFFPFFFYFMTFPVLIGLFNPLPLNDTILRLLGCILTLLWLSLSPSDTWNIKNNYTRTGIYTFNVNGLLECPCWTERGISSYEGRPQ